MMKQQTSYQLSTYCCMSVSPIVQTFFKTYYVVCVHQELQVCIQVFKTSYVDICPQWNPLPINFWTNEQLYSQQYHYDYTHDISSKKKIEKHWRLGLKFISTSFLS